MNTRYCLNCGEAYQSDAKESLPFCSPGCRKWHFMTSAEREEFKEMMQSEDFGEK